MRRKRDEIDKGETDKEDIGEYMDNENMREDQQRYSLGGKVLTKKAVGAMTPITTPNDCASMWLRCCSGGRNPASEPQTSLCSSEHTLRLTVDRTHPRHSRHTA